MQKKYLNGYIASMIIIKFYNKLIDLTERDMEDTEEYYALVERINNLVNIENEEYAKLTLKEVEFFLVNIKEDEVNSELDKRYFNKLNEQRKVLLGEPKLSDYTLLSSLINSKITIDTLNELDKKLTTIKEEETLPEEVITNVIAYSKIAKYDILTENNYLEKISLDHYFDITDLPNLDFREIEKKFNIPFIDNAKTIFVDYIIDSIEYLSEDKDEYDIVETLETFYESVKIEVILSYLDKESLKELEKTIAEVFDNSKGHIVKIIKKLIKSKGEELN